VATRLNTDRAALLGRTLAHEFGHLLLASNSHGAFGLMRAMWPDAVIRSETAPEWSFSNGEARQMKLALGRRTEESLHRRRLQAEAAPGDKDPS
jgi:hypothetical protein